MPEKKQGFRPINDGGKAFQESEADGGDLVIYTCWKCGADLHVPATWAYFICWKDGTLNYTN